MLIKETKLRKIIRETLIQEGLLTSAIEEVGHVKIDLGDKTYKVQALGGTTIEGKEVLVFSIPKDLRTKHSKRIKFLKIKKLPKKDYNLDNKFSPGGKLKITSTAPAEPGRYYITKDDLKKSANLEASKEKLQTGKATSADLAIEIGGLVGMIPAVGTPVDVGTAILAMIKDPPDYITAALSVICAIPLIGIGSALIKPIARKFKGKPVEEVGSALGEELSQVLEKNGIELSDNLIDKTRDEVAKSINSLKQSSLIQNISKVTNTKPNVITKGLDETLEVADEIMKGMTDMGLERGGLGIRIEAKKKLKEKIRKESGAVIKSLKSGKIRAIVENNAKEIYQRVSKQYDKQIAEAFENVIGSGKSLETLSQANKFLESTKFLVGKKIRLPDPPGGDLVYKNLQEFKESIHTVCIQKGLSPQDVFIGAAKDIAENGYKPTTLQNVDKIVDLTIKRFSDVKIKYLDDKAIASQLGHQNRYGRYSPNSHTIFMNISNFGDGASRSLDDMSQTMQEEMIHCIDGAALSVILMGDSFAKSLLDGAQEASFVYAQKIFNPKKSTSIVVPNFEKATTESIKSKVFTYNSKFAIKKGGKQYVPSVSSFYEQIFKNGSESLDEAAKIISKEFELPRFHSIFFAHRLKYLKENFPNTTTKKVLNDIGYEIGYNGNPPEFLAKAFNLSEAIKKAGFDPSDNASIMKFMKKYDTFEALEKDVVKLKDNEVFRMIYDSYKNVGEFKGVFGDIWTPFSKFMNQKS